MLQRLARQATGNVGQRLIFRGSVLTPSFGYRMASYGRPRREMNPPLVLHCQFTNNNTILTLSRRVYRDISPPEAGILDQEYLINQVHPQQEALLTVSSGQLGFKGTKKSTYDAAFQTCARMFQLMEDKGHIDEGIELVLRNFGENRQAFQNVLMGKEGTKVRRLIKRVTDATKIKFGGDRAPNRRRV